VSQDEVAIGVRGYRDPEEFKLKPSLALPFVRHDAWLTIEGDVPSAIQAFCAMACYPPDPTAPSPPDNQA